MRFVMRLLKKLLVDFYFFANWISRPAQLADPVRPMWNNSKNSCSGFPIACIFRLPDWAVQSVLPIASSRLVHRFYPLARPVAWADGSRIGWVVIGGYVGPQCDSKCKVS